MKNIEINELYYNQILNNTKLIEVKKNNNKWNHFVKGDTIRFINAQNKNQSFTRAVTNITIILPCNDPFEQLFNKIGGIEPALPGITDIQTAIDTYCSFGDDLSTFQTQGLIGIWISQQ